MQIELVGGFELRRRGCVMAALVVCPLRARHTASMCGQPLLFGAWQGCSVLGPAVEVILSGLVTSGGSLVRYSASAPPSK